MNHVKRWSKDTCEHSYKRGSLDGFISFRCKKCGDLSLITSELFEELTK